MHCRATHLFCLRMIIVMSMSADKLQRVWSSSLRRATHLVCLFWCGKLHKAIALAGHHTCLHTASGQGLKEG